MTALTAPADTEELLAVLEQNGWRTAAFRRKVNPDSCGLLSRQQGMHQQESQPLEAPQEQQLVQQRSCEALRVSDVVAREAAIAYGRIRPFVRNTPLEPSPWLSSLPPSAAEGCPGAPESCTVVLKLESEQHTGSFKVRGALNKLLSLPTEVLSRGVFTASTGNHALAVLHAATALSSTATGSLAVRATASTSKAAGLSPDPPPTGLLPMWPQRPAGPEGQPPPAPSARLEGRLEASGRDSAAAGRAPEWGYEWGTEGTDILRPRIYVPETASSYKIRKLQSLGAQLHVYGAECLATESAARSAAAAAGAVYVSPYNDIRVMGGQGTVALELLAARRRGQLDVVLVPVGGGGLIAGVASVLKAADPCIQVVGCQPALSDVMARSVAVGAVQPENCVQRDDGAAYGTLSDATAGGVESDALTLQPCTDYVDEWVVLEEGEIAEALVELLEEHSKLVEGAAACALAAFKRLAPRLAGLSVVVVCCGGNIALPTLRRALDMARPGVAQ